MTELRGREDCRGAAAVSYYYCPWRRRWGADGPFKSAVMQAYTHMCRCVCAVVHVYTLR